MAWHKKAWVKSYSNRLKKYDEDIKKLLEKIEHIKEEKNDLQELMKNPADTFEDSIFKTYIEHGRIKDVIAWINLGGHMLQTASNIGKRKYMTNDISEILRSQKNRKDNKFAKEAYRLFVMNSYKE